MKKNAIIVSVVLFAILISAGMFVLKKYAVPPVHKVVGRTENTPVACAKDLQNCPDGTLVGRSGPTCDFTPCPKPIDTGSWKTMTDAGSGATFQYPETLGTAYIAAQQWPPKLALAAGPLTCVVGGSDVQSQGETRKTVLSSREFCVKTQIEGAAGSTYVTFTYSVATAGPILTLTFTLREAQCANYDDPQKTACEKERAEFSPDALAARILQSVQL